MTGVTNPSTKRKLRLENKKKKMAALIDIAKLNEYDRQKLKNKKIELSISTEAEPSPKKLKTEESQNDEPPPPLIGDIGPSGKPKLQGEELADLKRMLREKTKQIRSLPNFRLREMGENASLKVDIENRCPLFLSDVQHLIMYSQIGVHAPYSPARWCALEKYNRLANTNVLIVENMSLYHFANNESLLPFLSSKFEHKLEIITPSSHRSDIVKELSMVPLTGTQMKKFMTNFGSLEKAVHESKEVFDTVKNFFPIDSSENVKNGVNSDNALPPTDKFSRTQLLLSGWQMIEENFPLPIKGLMERKYTNYVLTKDHYKEVTPFSPMFAIDCEMCKTTTGEIELTRISAVNEQHEVIYETLVKPDNKIVDYLTKWSGITSKMMKNVTKKLKDVQEELGKILPADAILVGQSLCNDLHALKMMHPYVIDTSVIYNITGDRLRKTKLQTLAREFLSEKIQIGSHCSNEDSLACMKLAQLKLSKSIYYGDAVMNQVYSESRAYPEMGTSNYATSMLKQCTKVDKKARVIGVDDVGTKYKYFVDKNSETSDMNIECISERSNKEVIKNFVENFKEFSLNIAHLRVANNQFEGNSTKVFKTLDKWVREVYEATVSPGFVCVLLGGQTDGGNGACFLQVKRDIV